MAEASRKLDPVNVEYEALAKNLLKGELKRRGVTYGQFLDQLCVGCAFPGHLYAQDRLGPFFPVCAVCHVTLHDACIII